MFPVLLNYPSLQRPLSTYDQKQDPRNRRSCKTRTILECSTAPLTLVVETAAAKRLTLQGGSGPGTTWLVTRLRIRIPIIGLKTTICEFKLTLLRASKCVKKCLTSNEIRTILVGVSCRHEMNALSVSADSLNQDPDPLPKVRTAGVAPPLFRLGAPRMRDGSDSAVPL